MATTSERAFYASHSQDWLEREATRCARRSTRWIEVAIECSAHLCFEMGEDWLQSALGWNATACELRGFEVGR